MNTASASVRARWFSPLTMVGVALIVIAGLASMALRFRRQQAESAESLHRSTELGLGPLVQTAPVLRGPPGRTIAVNGEVHAYRESTLYAKVSGYLKLVRVDKGDHVDAGEILGVIEAPEVEQEVASKRADLSVKKLTDARVRALAGNGVVSQQEMEKAHADVQIASADLGRLDALRGYQVIRAPFAGTVTARYADPGALLQAATSSQAALPLIRLADLDRVRVFIYLGQADALAVREGDAVTITTDGAPALPAKIARFEKELDEKTRTMLTEIDLDNREAKLYPGAFVRARLQVAEPAALSLPADAVMYEAGKPTVAMLRDGHAHFAPIEMLSSDGQTVRLRSGLEEGDHVILHPGDEVADGSPVREEVAAGKHGS